MQNEDNKPVKIGNENLSSTSISYTSSVPVITLLCRSQTRSKKILYFILFIVSTGTCFFHMLQFISLCLQYPVLNFMSTENELSAEFPAVTICNLNRAKSTYQERIKNGSEFEFVVAGYSGVLKIRKIIFTERKSYSVNDDNDEDNTTYHYRNEARDFFNNYIKLEKLSHNYYGYSLYDIVTDCHFNSQPCYHNNFSHFQHLQYGNCYTFNRRKDMGSQRLKSFQLGPESGLELTLKFGVDDYLDLTPSVGIRVVIHDAEEDPDPMENGFNISPGFEFYVAVSRSSIQRLPPPYRDQCFEYGRSGSFSSQTECVRSCMQKVYASRCSCVEPFMNAGKNERRCDMRNVTEMLCLDTVLEYLKESGLPCDCPTACVTNNYDFGISSSYLTTHDVYSTTFIYLPDYTLYNFSSFQDLDIFNNNHSDDFPDISLQNNIFSNFSYSNNSFQNNSSLNFSFLDNFFQNYNFPKYYFPIILPSGNNSQGIIIDYSMNFSHSFNLSEYIPDFEDYDSPKIITSRLKVFFKDFDKTIYFQTPMFTFSEIVSHIGGLLSLWLGFSFLAFFELFEVIFSMIARRFR